MIYGVIQDLANSINRLFYFFFMVQLNVIGSKQEHNVSVSGMITS